MEKEEYWDSFFASGKVADYLSYCRAEKQEADRDNKNAIAKTGEGSDDKVKYNAGFY